MLENRKIEENIIFSIFKAKFINDMMKINAEISIQEVSSDGENNY